MYTQFFKLRDQPFKQTPRASVFHENSGSYPAYRALYEGIKSGQPLILLTGATGTGKTLCAQKLMADLGNRQDYACITIPFTSLPFDEMLAYICGGLELRFGLGQNENKMEILEVFLMHGISPIRSVIIIIDEAQNVSADVFDGLVQLLDLSANTSRKIQIVVMTRSESDLHLNRPEMAAFSHKITLRTELEPISANELDGYIKYQLVAAGAAYSDVFTKDAIARIYAYTQGRPRLINILCDLTMDVAASEKKPVITSAHVDRAQHQHQFDDTIEMRTSQVSAAIARFANNNHEAPTELPEPDEEAVQSPASMFTSETGEAISLPEIRHIDDVQTLPSAVMRADPETLQPLTNKPVKPVKRAGLGLTGWSLLTLIGAGMLGILYLQFQQQQRTISQLEQQLSHLQNTPATTDKIESADLPGPEPAAQPIEQTADPELTSEITTPEINQARKESNEPVADAPVMIPEVTQASRDDHKETSSQTRYLENEEFNTSERQRPTIELTPVRPDPSPDAETTSQATETKTTVTAIGQLLSIADYQISVNNLTEPEGDNAMDSYRQILAFEPDNNEAHQGLQRIKQLFINWALNNEQGNNLDRARRYYEKALLIDPEDTEIPEKIATLNTTIEQRQNTEITGDLLDLAKQGNSVDLTTLLEKGAYPDTQDNSGNTPLMLAAERGHLQAVQTLLSHGASTDLANSAGDTALMNAVWNGNESIVDELLLNKVRVNNTNNRAWTAIMYAAIHGNLGIFKKLLAQGANLETRTDDGKTPLAAAAHNGHREIVSSALEQGASVDSQDIEKWTPLMHAVSNNHATVVQLLLMNNAKLNHRNNEGWTALMLAAWNGNSAIVKMLLENGADKSVKNSAEQTALDLATDQQHAAVTSLLR